MKTPKARVFWPLLTVVLLADCGTKQLVEENLEQYQLYPLFGEAVRLTLAYNPGAATGFIPFGDYSRELLSALAMLVVALLFFLFRRAHSTDHRLGTALALVIGGALGNLYDRLRSPQGVVDFIDVGVGDYRFWTFNFADVGITVGALLLGVILWQRDRELELGERPSAEGQQLTATEG